MQTTVETCDGVELARSVVEAARSYVPPNIKLELSAPKEAPPIEADPDKARQVLTNLVDNAVKYSPDGGRVTVEVTVDGQRLRYAVRDEGLGVPPAEHRRIFEKFYRLDPDLTRGVGGTGLGLYISRELLERMGGRIWVESSGSGRLHLRRRVADRHCLEISADRERVTMGAVVWARLPRTRGRRRN